MNVILDTSLVAALLDSQEGAKVTLIQELIVESRIVPTVYMLQQMLSTKA